MSISGTAAGVKRTCEYNTGKGPPERERPRILASFIFLCYHVKFYLSSKKFLLFNILGLFRPLLTIPMLFIGFVVFLKGRIYLRILTYPLTNAVKDT